MVTLTLNNDEKLVFFDLIYGIDIGDIHVNFDNAQRKLISDLVVQLEPKIDEPFLPEYGKIIDQAKKNMRSEWED